MKINDLLAVNLNEETGKEMLKIFRGMHHDAGMNKDMDRYILSHNWQLGNFTPDMFPSEEEFFDYDDPFDRIIDIDYSHRVDLSQPIIVGPQYSDGKYSVVDGNHRAAAAQRMGKTIRAYFPVKKTNENLEAKVTKESSGNLTQWRNKEPANYVKHLQKFFGPPDELTNQRAIWHDKDGFKRIEVLDEFILHASPVPHYDYVYSYIDLKVPHSLSDELSASSESILIDHLKGEVGARCASLSANAVTLQYVMDVVEGNVKPSKVEYETRIKAMKKMFADGERYELDWWPDETKDTDPDNPYYKDPVDENVSNAKKTSSGNSYMLKLERDRRAGMLVLHILNKQTGKRTEVRGKPGYETNGYDPNDKLHQLLDKVGKSASVSDLMNGDVVSINPRHPDGASAKAATDKAYNENFADGKKPGRKGLAKRMGVNTKASVSDLRKTAKNSSGEKQRMAHWLANMKAGKEK
jgi:hypothetical protein